MICAKASHSSDSTDVIRSVRASAHSFTATKSLSSTDAPTALPNGSSMLPYSERTDSWKLTSEA